MAQSCQLSKIGRTLNESTCLKKAIDRLTANLSAFENGEGYHTLGVSALTPEKKQPIGVYTKVYSAADPSFISEDHEALMALKFLSKHFKKSNIRAFDRGYDANVYYRHLISNGEKFIIRSKKNRDVLYKGETINILEFANRFKGKYGLKFRKKNGMSADCKITIVPIRLYYRPNDDLNLVICYGFAKTSMMLITNLCISMPISIIFHKTFKKVYNDRHPTANYIRA